MFVDRKFKETAPENTVAKIQSILSSFEIETVESGVPSGVRHCHSMRVSVKDVEFGANGKGMTEAYSRASGYAEFMERIQGGYLSRRIWRDQRLDFPDEREMRQEDCAASCAAWLEAMRVHHSELLGRPIPAWQIWQKVFEAEGERDGVTALPFYDPVRDETVWFPKKAVSFLYNTNGLAAGNDLTEAAVQSLSEIYERWNLVRMFFGDYVPPSIPEEHLRRYPKIWEIIEDLRSSGFRVLVKDCSLGEPFPLVAAVVVNPETHAYHVHLGAFPAYEIALERSFTEMFQGRSLKTVADTTTVTLGDVKSRSSAELIKFLTHGTGRYPLSFFSEPPSYPFRPFPDRSDRSNRELLQEYLDYLNARGFRVYLRNISHLGFPSVRVVVPGMSEIMPTQLLDGFPISWMLEQYRGAPLRPDLLSAGERQEYRLLLDYLLSNYGEEACDLLFLSGRNPDRTNRSRARFLGLVLYGWMEWERDPQRAMSYARMAQQAADPAERTWLACFCAYGEQLAAGQDPDRTRSGLALLFDEKTVAETVRVRTAGENPFDRFLLRCDPERCEGCPYHESCSGWTTDAFVGKIREIVSRFDSEAARQALRSMFGKVDH